MCVRMYVCMCVYVCAYVCMCVCVCVCSGPVVLLRLELGVLSRGCVGPGQLVAEYIRNNKLDQVLWAIVQDHPLFRNIQPLIRGHPLIGDHMLPLN